MVSKQSNLLKTAWARYGVAVLAVAAGLLLRMALTAWVGEGLPTYITFFPAVVVAALLAGRGPGLAATVLAVVAVDYWVNSPDKLFFYGTPVEATGVVLFLIMGAFLTALTELYRQAREKSSLYERELALRNTEAEKHRAEQELEQTSEGYRLALKAGNLGTWNYNFETGKVFWDERCRDLFGVAHGDRIDYDKALSLMHADDRGRVNQQVQAALAPDSTGAYECDYRVTWPDGTVRWVVAKGQVYFQGDGAARKPQRFIGTVRDITESKQAEESLRRSEKLYRAIGESIDYGVWVCEPDGRNIYASESFLKLVGITQEQCSNFGWGNVLHPDDAERTIAAWKECVRTGGTWDIEHRFLGLDGQYHDVLARGVPVRDEGGRIVCWAGINLDISRLKRVEAALAKAYDDLEQKVEERTARLRESNRRLGDEIRVRREAESLLKEAELRYRTVADFTYDWEYWKTPQGALCYCSPSCERVTGYTSAELIAEPQLLRQLIVPEEQANWDEHESAAFKDGAVREIEFRIRRKEGDIRWIEHTCRPVTGSQGEFLGIRASNRDITERKHGEMEMQRLREELNRFSRITAAGQLAASIAHEMTQPLGAALCNAQAAETWLAGKEVDVPAAQEALKDIQADCRRAGAVIQRLRSLYQKGDLELTPLQLNDVIRETVELINSELVFHDVKVQFEFDTTSWQILGNQVELRQVILNLLMNAIEAMAPCDPGKRHLSISTWCEAPGTVRVAISDSGPGLGREELGRAFEPFYTTKPTGMGMGLAISRSIIEGHRGKLWVVNNSGRGATFHLALPAIPEGTV